MMMFGTSVPWDKYCAYWREHCTSFVFFLKNQQTKSDPLF
jgi:hypothetical protein